MRPTEERAEAGRRLALLADLLTAGRALIAIGLIPILGTGRVALGALLVGVAWLSDFFDGRAARASGVPTVLGSWDLDADTAVGGAIVLGFTFSGWVEWWLGIGSVVVLLVAFSVSRNEAMSMLLQATGYALLLWQTAVDGHAVALGWLVGVIVVIGIVNRRQLFERSIPTFLEGLGLISRGRHSG